MAERGAQSAQQSRTQEQLQNKEGIQMRLRACFVLVSFLSVVVCTTVAQTAAPNSTLASTQVPRLIKFSGVAQDQTHKPVSGVVGVTFSLYKDQQGGSPLWVETQNVQVDATGHYTVMLGSASADGVPLSLFSSAEAHWISTQIAGQPEQPRVLLLSVPYALKAADAETLGGLPASAFMRANANGALGTAGSKAGSAATGTVPPAGVTGTGTKNFIPVWTGATTLGNSVIYETGGNVGVGTKTPKAKVDVVGAGTLGIQATVPGTQAAIAGIATAVKGGTTGVYGQSSDPTGNAVFGLDNATTGGNGVIGISSAPSGSSNGVYGQSASTSGVGVAGNETAKTGGVAGVMGTALSTGQFSAGVSGYESATTGQVFGVSGSSNSTTANSAGVAGVENATIGAVSGVAGNANSTSNGAAGVNGFEGGATGQVYGVTGVTNSSTNFAAGVRGYEGATSGQVFGVQGGTSSTTNFAAGVSGNANGTSGQVYGVVGVSNSTTSGAAAVNGYEPATTGGVYGVFGSTPSTSGIGVGGVATATSGTTTGVVGQTASIGNGSTGVFGGSSGTSGVIFGVQGISNSASGASVSGSNNASTGGTAVSGQANATTGRALGVYGQSASTSGIGVTGNAFATSGVTFGVQGFSASPNGIGVQANNNSTGGVVAIAGPSPFLLNAFVGKFGAFTVDNSGNGFYGGNLIVTGKLTKGSGSFKIDHPLDPANKYLSHSFVESPDMMNVYNGNITTDRRGLATVTLPDYFEALNGEFRYQLTVIGKFAQAIVAKKIDANRFVIRTSKPNVEVSWQVTGIRHDAYANRYRIPVEEDKAVGEQGYYLHPEVFGQPESKSISMAPKPAPSSQDVVADASHN
jgi:hypothetical protein